MKNLRIFILAVYLIGYYSISWSQVNVSLSDYSVTKGDTVVIPIAVSDVSGYDLISYEITLLFQSTVLKPLELIDQGTLSENWSSFINTEFPGRIELGGINGTQYFPAGSGTLVKIVFEVMGDYGDTTSIIFDSAVFNNNNPTAITNNGFLTVKLELINVIVTTSVSSEATVIVDGEIEQAPFVTQWYPGTSHTLSVESPQSRGEGTKYQFIAWSDGGAQTHNVAPASDITYVAIMSTEYFLALKSSHGSPIGEGWYHEGDSVTISIDQLIPGATGTQYQFVGWVGHGTGAYTGPDNPVTFQIMGPITETVTWQTQYYLQVQTIPLGLADISGAGWYNKNSVAITGKAPQTVYDGQLQRQFKGWKLDGFPIEGNPVSVTMDAAHKVNADYSLDISVTVTTNIGRGTYIIIDGQRIDAPASVAWSIGSHHTIACPEAQAEKDGQRFKFVSWNDQGAREHTIAPEKNMVYTAELKTEYQVSISTDPPNIVDIEGSGWYDIGRQINIGPATQIVDHAGKSYAFVNWRIDTLIIDTDSFSMTVDTPKKIMAKYFQNLFITGYIKIGDVGVSNIKVLLTGVKDDSAVTNDMGEFVFEGLIPGAYKITPRADGFDFNPRDRNFSMLLFNLRNQDFAADDMIPPEIEVISPNGGEILHTGNTDSIQWNASDNVKLDSVNIFYSTDSGENWIHIQPIEPFKSSYSWSIPDISSMDCKIKIKVIDVSGNVSEDVSDQNFTISNGTIVSEKEQLRPIDFYVKQNYPNPFNSSTEIEYRIPMDCKLSIYIFNVYGQQIRTLVSGYQSAGNHKTHWDATDTEGAPVPSGIYYYRAQAGSHSRTRRMILLR